MGLKTSKDLKDFEPGCPELVCLSHLGKQKWPEQDWHEIFTLCGDNDEFLLPKQASRFFGKLFKYLRLPGSLRQFVASAMLRLDVQRKGRLYWKDILLLHQCGVGLEAGKDFPALSLFLSLLPFSLLSSLSPLFSSPPSPPPSSPKNKTRKCCSWVACTKSRPRG